MNIHKHTQYTTLHVVGGHHSVHHRLWRHVPYYPSRAAFWRHGLHQRRYYGRFAYFRHLQYISVQVCGTHFAANFGGNQVCFSFLGAFYSCFLYPCRMTGLCRHVHIQFHVQTQDRSESFDFWHTQSHSVRTACCLNLSEPRCIEACVGPEASFTFACMSAQVLVCMHEYMRHLR